MLSNIVKKLPCAAIIGVLFFSASQAQAARFHKIETMTRPEFETLARIAQSAVNDEVFGNCGTVVKTKVTYKSSREPWRNSVKQMLWGEYVEGISAVEIQPKTQAAALEAIGQFADTGRESGFADDDIIAFEERELTLKKATRDALAAAPDWLGFTGTIEGAFSMGLNWVAFIDTEHQEMLMFGDGYCE